RPLQRGRRLPLHRQCLPAPGRAPGRGRPRGAGGSMPLASLALGRALRRQREQPGGARPRLPRHRRRRVRLRGAAMSAPAVVADRQGRPLRNLRLSVTDRCNLRCAYCMPEEEYVWLPREDILTFEEAAQLVDVFADLGVDKVRLTGGEPLLRNGLERLVILLAANPRLRDLAITTNGILLCERAGALRAAGLHRVTVSLDTLRP